MKKLTVTDWTTGDPVEREFDPLIVLRDKVVGVMPWYDESNPDYTELDAVLREALDATAQAARAEIAEKVRGLPWRKGITPSPWHGEAVAEVIDRAAVLRLIEDPSDDR